MVSICVSRVAPYSARGQAENDKVKEEKVKGAVERAVEGESQALTEVFVAG